MPLPDVIVGAPAPEVLLVGLGGVALIVGLIVFGPLGRALADGLRHLFGVHRAPDNAELGAMREEVAALRHRVAELEERQDFAERLLAQARERGLLSAPPEP
jgi:hypothetical protein